VLIAMLFEGKSTGGGAGTPVMKHGLLAAVLNCGVGTAFTALPVALAVYWSLLPAPVA